MNELENEKQKWYLNICLGAQKRLEPGGLPNIPISSKDGDRRSEEIIGLCFVG